MEPQGEPQESWKGAEGRALGAGEWEEESK